MINEDKIRSLCKLKSLNDIPGLPFKSFDELKVAVYEGTYAIDVSYPAARELSTTIRTPLGAFNNLILLFAPWIMMLCVVGVAIWLGNYLVLLGLPIALISNFIGNPMAPGKGFFGMTAWLAFLFLLFAIWQGWYTTTWLLASGVVPFFSNREMYRENISALHKAVLNSETLFLYLYEKYAIRLRNTETGEEYWNIGDRA
jgi:hypothetical protein